MNSAFANGLDKWTRVLQADPALFEPEQLRARMDVLDELDALISDSHAVRTDALHARAIALREHLEAANGKVYAAIRDEVQRGRGAECIRHWLASCKEAEVTRAGLGYDRLDELIAGVLGLREPAGESILAPEMVFYQPTPARHILDMIRLCNLSENDVLIDLGSGLGHVPVLASILTGARAIGIEIDPAYVRCARECASGLGLERVTFVEQDVREADLSAGTVFHLYTPFTGTMLRTALECLRVEARRRTIRVSALGPCTEVIAAERWLSALNAINPDRISCFRSLPIS